jgi:hypothetical protein
MLLINASDNSALRINFHPIMTSAWFKNNHSLQPTLAELEKEDVSKCFQQYHNLWACCIKSIADYCEVDSMEYQVNSLIRKRLSGNLMITRHIAVIKMYREREKIMQTVEMITERPLAGLKKKK